MWRTGRSLWIREGSWSRGLRRSCSRIRSTRELSSFWRSSSPTKFKSVGCHPNWPQGQDPKLALRLRPWAATQTGLKGGLSPPPLRIPGSLKHVPCIPALFQKLLLLPQNPAAARFPPVGLQPAQKLAVFHLFLRRDFAAHASATEQVPRSSGSACFKKTWRFQRGPVLALFGRFQHSRVSDRCS
jgi:hypothetical protein